MGLVGEGGAPAAKLADEAGQCRTGAGLQLVGLDQPLGCAVEREAVRPRKLVDRAQRDLAEAALGQVHDALEGEIVVGARHDADVGDGVPDLLALVEAQAADHAVGQADGEEALLEGSGLEAGADQDGDAVEALAALLQRLDGLADGARLLVAVPALGDADLLAVLALGPERLAEAAGIVGDQARGGGQDVPGGAVVALQPDHLRAGEVLLEAEDVADLGAAPAVDRLVVVADAADAVMGLRQQPEPQVLRDVGVLILVHQQVAERCW